MGIHASVSCFSVAGRGGVGVAVKMQRLGDVGLGCSHSSLGDQMKQSPSIRV